MKLEWNLRRLPGEIERDMREAARRKGAPSPASAPKIAVKHFSESDVLRLPPNPRRRIVVTRVTDD